MIPLDEKCIIDPERDCIGKAAAVKLEARIESLERWQTESQRFHKDFDEWQKGQIGRDARLDEKLTNMEASLNKLLARQEDCDQKPGKRWDAIVDKAIWAVLAAIITFILARIGL